MWLSTDGVLKTDLHKDKKILNMFIIIILEIISNAHIWNLREYMKKVNTSGSYLSVTSHL